MIHVYMRGRLGNQLFQYAFVRMLQHYNPNIEVAWHWDEVFSQGSEKDGWGNALSYFNTIDTKNECLPKLTIIQKICYKLYWFKYPHQGNIEKKNRYQKRWLNLLNRVGLYYLDLGYFPFKKIVPLKSDIIVSGNFESPQYFIEIDNLLRKEIQPRFSLLPHNNNLMQTIENTESVCVSIRRGDYVSNIDFKKLFNICGKQYYDRAIEYVQSRIQNPVFVFFSDDIEWVKRNLHYDVPCYYERGDDPIWEKLRLMYSCKHFIISNSTFSWWAQHLGKFPEKMVLAPSKWYSSNFTPALYEENWTKIAVD